MQQLEKRRDAYGSRTLTGEKRILLHRAELYRLGGETPSAVDCYGLDGKGKQETRRKNAGGYAKGLHDSQGSGVRTQPRHGIQRLYAVLAENDAHSRNGNYLLVLLLQCGKAHHSLL